MADKHSTTSAQELRDLLRARYPIVYVVSSEEERVEAEVARWVEERRERARLEKKLAKLEARKLITWTINEQGPATN